MICGKYSKSMPLCPVSLGLALGLTCALAVVAWSVWVMWHGVSTMMMVSHMVPPSTLAEVGLLAGWCFLKGFVFGLVLALLYDLIACCCKARCCKKENGTCGCGNPSCGCCSTNPKP